MDRHRDSSCAWPFLGILLLALLLPVSCLAEITFEKIFYVSGGSRGYCVRQTEEGGYIVAGYGAGDVYLIKTDSLGVAIWNRRYGGGSSDRGYWVEQTRDRGYIITGETWSFGAGGSDVYLIKTDSSGDTVWTRTYGGTYSDEGHSVKQTSDGGYVIAGMTLRPDMHIYLIKTDSLGDSVWTKIYGGVSTAEAHSIIEIENGDYVIAGRIFSTVEPILDNVYLIRTDSEGETLWTRTYGTNAWDRGRSVEQTDDGGYIIAGETGDANAGWGYLYLIKTDSLGDTLWTRTFGGTGRDRAYSAQQTSDGGYIVTGFIRFGDAAIEQYVYLVRTDSLGDTLWTRTYGHPWSCGYSVRQVNDGGYVIAGGTFGDPYLVKTDGNGFVERDGGVLSLDSPGDTVFCDSIYPVIATIRNFGPNPVTTGVVARMGAYFDTVEVQDLGPYSSVQVTFRDWQVPRSDSTNNFLQVCTSVVYDRDTTNDCKDKVIFSYIHRFHDAGFVSIDSPGDTVFPDSVYSIKATVRNFGNLIDTLDVVVFIDGYQDEVRLEGVAPNSPVQVTFKDWQVPSIDSISYMMIVCAYVSNDVDTSNDCGHKLIFGVSPVGVEEESNRRLEIVDYRLSQNQPNPYNRLTSIEYCMPVGCSVSLRVFDITGRPVETLVDKKQRAGAYRVRWDAKDQSSGIYFYRLQAGDFVETKKMTLLR
ncbi:T9SS type A sorting domain-containing protein [candidate division TA06 bacterium]|uniref:T9SS type A sorting domain-containing protein n=1 Tax=candidate division TA06 bacterium TaxID=2250710 RepID=A0A523UY37_UNCT6|nr:MAG: T9SS type A sorting domain-containing protein [candidate division TA06 bacterium]